jgi:hypothetical protein
VYEIENGYLKNLYMGPGMVTHTYHSYNPTTQEAEVEGYKVPG